MYVFIFLFNFKKGIFLCMWLERQKSSAGNVKINLNFIANKSMALTFNRSISFQNPKKWYLSITRKSLWQKFLND